MRMQRRAPLMTGLLLLTLLVPACVHQRGVQPPEVSPLGASPQETVASTLRHLEAGNVDRALTHYAPDYKHHNGGTIDHLADFLVTLEERGWLDGLEFDFKRVEIELDLDRAYVEVLLHRWKLGEVLTTFELEYDGAEWLIIHSTDF